MHKLAHLGPLELWRLAQLGRSKLVELAPNCRPAVPRFLEWAALRIWRACGRPPGSSTLSFNTSEWLATFPAGLLGQAHSWASTRSFLRGCRANESPEAPEWKQKAVPLCTGRPQNTGGPLGRAWSFFSPPFSLLLCSSLLFCSPVCQLAASLQACRRPAEPVERCEPRWPARK